MIKVIYIVFCLVFLGWYNILNALEEPPTFKHLGSADGLSNHLIYTIQQGSQGFLWVGTQYGLNRYDASEFKVFVHDPDNADSISGNYVWDMMTDSKGRLWIAVWGGGLNLYLPESESFRRFVYDKKNLHSLPTNNVWRIFEDSKGRLWLATEKGLALLDEESGTFTTYEHDPSDPNSISHNEVSSLAEASGGKLWVATYGGGLDLFDPDSGKILKHFQHSPSDPNSLGDNNIWKIYKDSNGSLWIGTSKGMDLFQEEGTFKHFLDGETPQASNAIISFHEDSNKNLWIGTYSKCLEIMDLETMKISAVKMNLKDPSAPQSSRIYAISESKDETVWLGTSNGLTYHSPHAKIFKHYPHVRDDSAIEGDGVFAIYCDDGLWLGTQKGLSFFDPKTGEKKSFGGPLQNSTIKTIHPDAKGNFWLASLGKGLGYFNPKDGSMLNFRSKKGVANSLSHNLVRSLDLDSKGRVWMLLVGYGLEMYDPSSQKFTHFQNLPEDTITSIWVRDLHVDAKDRVWISYESNGVCLYDPTAKTFRNFTSENSDIRNGSILDIFEDSTGIINLATANGLSRYDPKTDSFENYGIADGFASNYIASIEEDENGDLWLYSNNLVMLFDFKTNKIRNFSTKDGLPLNSPYFHTAARDKSGVVYFGGDNGLTACHPKWLKENSYKHEIVLTDFRIFNKSSYGQEGSPLERPVSVSDHITLSYRHSVFSFGFSALNFINPNKNQYLYKLEGFDQDWIKTDSNFRRATYTNIAPGDYTFKVKASNNDGVWSDKNRSILVTIVPPWWKTIWAYCLFLATPCLIIFTAVFLRFKLIRTQNLLLEGKVEDRTKELLVSNEQLLHANEVAENANRAKSEFLANMSHEIRTPMNAVLGFSEILLEKETDTKKLRYIDNIHTSGKALLSLINDILDLSKVESGKFELQYGALSLKELLVELQTLFSQKLKKKGLRLAFEVGENIPELLVLDEPRIRQVLINLLGNAIKFTDKGLIRVSVSVKFTDSGHNVVDLRIIVKDSGIGIHEDQIGKIFGAFEQSSGQKVREFGGTGLGLAISQRIVQLMGGTIRIESEFGKGSSFIVEIPDVEIASTKASQLENKPPIDPSMVEFSPATILIADDFDYNREIVNTFIEKFDFTTINAKNGTEAIEKTKEHMPDLILMDMKTPVMDGYKASEILKRDPELKHIPIIAVTASALKDDERVIEKLCDGYLSKPICQSELIGGLMQFLSYTEITPECFTKKTGDAGDAVTTLTPEALNRFPALLKLLHEKEERANHLLNYMVINHIEEYAVELKELAEAHDCQPLKQWVEDTTKATKSFDINLIKEQMEQLIDAVKQ